MSSAHEPIRDTRVPGACVGEPIGGVNAYVARTNLGVTTHVFVTVNLACGTTPFATVFDCDGDKYKATSCCYNLPFHKATATYGFYRPDRIEFMGLDEDTKRHVLLGGLLHAPLAVAISRQCWMNPERVTVNDLRELAATAYGYTKALEDIR